MRRFVCALMIVAACAEQPEASDSDRRVAAETPSTPAVDTLFVEGQPTVVSVAPFVADSAFPLGFRTSVPEPDRLVAAIETVPASSDLDGAARFAWRSAAGPAFLRFVVVDSAMTDNTARGLIRAIATDFGVVGSEGIERDEAVPPPDHAWASLGYRLRGVAGGDPVTGWISMGEHAGRTFYFMALYPPEYGDALEPRFDYILRSWVWLDSGTGL